MSVSTSAGAPEVTVASVAVVADGLGGAPRIVRAISLPTDPVELLAPAAALGNSITDDGRYLLVADGNRGAVVLNVTDAERGTAGAVLGTLEGGGGRALAVGAIEVASSRDERYAFVSVEYPGAVAVYDLQAALADHFRRSGYVGSVKLGRAVVGMAVSPNGRWLYVTSELAAGTPFARALSTPGTLSVINIATAEHDPARSVVRTVDAGCQPVRVVVSANGRTVWVTARASDELLAFSAAKLRSDPRHALIAAVRVGEAPVGLALVRHDSRIVVADSNRFNAAGVHAALTVVDARAALAGKPAILGTLPAGAFPREMALEANGLTLLVSNNGSGQLWWCERRSRLASGPVANQSPSLQHTITKARPPRRTKEAG